MKGCAELPIAPRLARGATGAGGWVHSRSAEPHAIHPSCACANQCGFWGVLRPPFPLGNPGKLSFYS